jgi:type I restriction enzyme M protein
VVSRIFPTTHFGFRKITVERPLRFSFQATPERIERLEQEKSFQALATSKKKGDAGAKEIAAGLALQEQIRALVNDLPEEPFPDREEFEKLLSLAAKHAGMKLTAPARKAILVALGERDENAEICTNSDGTPEPDTELRDTESVPLPAGPDPIDDQGIPASVQTFFEREVLPHVSDAWINTSKRDERDGLVGLVGYEINFNRYFYRYTPPRPLEEIEADIRTIEDDILRMLAEVTAAGRA